MTTKRTYRLSLDTIMAAREALQLELAGLSERIKSSPIELLGDLRDQYIRSADALYELRTLPEGGELDTIRDTFERDCT